MSVKCAVSGKTVYPGDPQINLDGSIILKSKAKCMDCGSKLTVTNYHMSKNSDGTILLLCQTHYKARFSKTGVYAGADKFQKKTGQEVRAATAASSTGESTPSKVVKSTIWSPQGAVQQADTDYVLERSVTTPDRRPSLRASVGAGNAATAERRQSNSGADLLKERRNSLKAVESKANEEISETARRTSITRASGETTSGATETTSGPTETTSGRTEACACDPCECDPCECTKDTCACTDCKCEDCKCGKGETSVADNLKDLAADCNIPEAECPSLDGTLKVSGVTEKRLCTARESNNAPTVSYSGAKEGMKYCLIMTDPDAPSRAEPTYRSFCHWVCADYFGVADHKVAYCGPGPPCNSGLHRYAFCLYEQPDAADLDSLTKALEGRGGTCAHEAAKAAGLGPMVAIEYYEAEWDDSVDALHESIGFVPPPKFRSPAQLAKHGDA